MLTNPSNENHPYLESTETLVHDVEGIIVGTFPPISHLCDSLGVNCLTNLDGTVISPPDFPWFHGNRSLLWKYTPLDIPDDIARDEFPSFMMSRLKEFNITYTDIIQSCQRRAQAIKGNLKFNANDSGLYDIVSNQNLLEAVLSNKSLNRIYFTNSQLLRTNGLRFTRGELDTKTRDAFSLFFYSLFQLNVAVEFLSGSEWIALTPKNVHRVNDEFHLLSQFEVRLTKDGKERLLRVYQCISPAAVNRGMTRRNLATLKFVNQNNLNIVEGPSSFLRSTLRNFFLGL